jgi:hypothetical protein
LPFTFPSRRFSGGCFSSCKFKMGQNSYMCACMCVCVYLCMHACSNKGSFISSHVWHKLRSRPWSSC